MDVVRNMFSHPSYRYSYTSNVNELRDYKGNPKKHSAEIQKKAKKDATFRNFINECR